MNAQIPTSLLSSSGAKIAPGILDCLSQTGREFHQRGWVLGTSGNFSAVISRDPLRLAITASGADKGALSSSDILAVDEFGISEGPNCASAEAALHLAIVNLRQAGAVLHTHSVWSTILSLEYAGDGGLAIEGYEMLKGLSGIRTHAHREWLPVIENSQDMNMLSRAAQDALLANRETHGFLIAGHGLYTWGADLREAKRHVEVLEFLLEVTGRTARLSHRGHL